MPHQTQTKLFEIEACRAILRDEIMESIFKECIVWIKGTKMRSHMTLIRGHFLEVYEKWVKDQRKETQLHDDSMNELFKM